MIYRIGEEAYLGKGLGKRMIALLADKIFAFPDAQIVTADIDQENKASGRTLVACGFSLFDAEHCRYVLYKPSNGVQQAERTQKGKRML